MSAYEPDVEVPAYLDIPDDTQEDMPDNMSDNMSDNIPVAAPDAWDEPWIDRSRRRTTPANAGAPLRDPPADETRDADASGPPVIVADRWDIDPDVEMADEAYHGRRRADAPAARLWIVTAIVIIGLGAAVAVPLALTNGIAPAVSPSPEALGDRVAPSEALSDSPSPSGSPSASRTAVKIASVPSPALVTPVTYEAEEPAPATVRTGSARVRNNGDASGKKIVNRIGDWSDSDTTEANNGTLRFNEVTVPADGTYILTVFYAFLDDDPSRSAVITVNEADPQNVTFFQPNGCCSSGPPISIVLRKGVNTILFSNANNHAPAVDKIVISPP